MGFFDTLIKARQSAQDRANELNAKLAEARARQRAIEQAPAAKADLKAVVVRRVEALRTNAASTASAVLRSLLRDPNRLNSDAAAAAVGLLSAGKQPNESAACVEIDAVLALMFTADLSAALCKAVDDLDEPEGPTLQARAVELEKLGKQIAALEAEINALYAEADAAGVSLT